MFGRAEPFTAVRYEVLADQDLNKFAKGTIADGGWENGVLFAQEVVLRQQAKGVEVRLWVDASADLAVGALEIMRLDSNDDVAPLRSGAMCAAIEEDEVATVSLLGDAT